MNKQKRKNIDDKEWKSFDERPGDNLPACRYKVFSLFVTLLRVKDNGVITLLNRTAEKGKWRPYFSINCKNLRMYKYKMVEGSDKVIRRKVAPIKNALDLMQTLKHVPTSATLRDMQNARIMRMLREIYDLIRQETSKYGFNLLPISNVITRQAVFIPLMWINIKDARGRINSIKFTDPNTFCSDVYRYKNDHIELKKQKKTDTWHHLFYQLPYPKSIRKALIKGVETGMLEPQTGLEIRYKEVDGKKIAETVRYTGNFSINIYNIVDTELILDPDIAIEHKVKMISLGFTKAHLLTWTEYYGDLHHSIDRIDRTWRTKWNTIVDIIRLAKTLRLEKPRRYNSLKDLKRYHDDLTIEANQRNSDHLRDIVFKLPPIFDPFLDDSRFSIPKDARELSHHGADQHHCIAGYYSLSQRGDGFCLIFNYQKRQWSCWVNMGNIEDPKPYINQIHGIYNSNIPQLDLTELRRIIKEKGDLIDIKLGFGSEPVAAPDDEAEQEIAPIVFRPQDRIDDQIVRYADPINPNDVEVVELPF